MKDDFLLDPSYEDLDALSQREQLFALGGAKAAARKAKRKAKRADRKENRLNKKQNKINKLRSDASALLNKSSKPNSLKQDVSKAVKETVKPDSKKPSDSQVQKLVQYSNRTSPGMSGDGSSVSNKKPGGTKPKATKKPEASKPKQSFGQAFSAARKAQGAGGTFMWNGKKYSTNRADDPKPTKKGKSSSTSSKSSSSSSSKKSSYKPKSVGQIKTESAVAATTKNLQKGSNITLKKKSDTKLPGQGNTVRARGEAARSAYEKEQAAKKAEAKRKREAAARKQAKATMDAVVARKTDPVKGGSAGSGVVKRTDKGKKKKAGLNLPKKGSMLRTGGKKLY